MIFFDVIYSVEKDSSLNLENTDTKLSLRNKVTSSFNDRDEGS